MNYIYYALQLL